MSILEKFRRWKVRRAFRKYVPPKVVKQLLKDARVGELPNDEIRHFQFVLVHIDEAKPEEIPKVISTVVDAFFRSNAMLADIVSSLVVGYLGLPQPKFDSVEGRRNLVTTLLTENGRLIRIAHGQCDGLTGNFGTKGGWRYGEIIPNFSAALKKLFDAEFGAAVEII